MECEDKAGIDPQLVDTLRRCQSGIYMFLYPNINIFNHIFGRCLEKDPVKRATVQQLLSHPYLRPQQQQQQQRVCSSCKSAERAMAKVSNKRERNRVDLQFNKLLL